MVEDKEDYTRKVYVPMSFLALDDTPITFEGAVRRSLVVNDTETGLGYSTAKVDNHSARHEEGGADEIKVSNLPDYYEGEAELGGDFDVGEKIKCVRIGNMVTITGKGIELNHIDDYSISSASGAIPSVYRPTNTSGIVFDIKSTWLSEIIVHSDGRFVVGYRDWEGVGYKRTGTHYAPTITYSIM